MNEIRRRLPFAWDDNGERGACTWSWKSTDPLIVRLDFGNNGNGRNITWEIGREILDGGLNEPTGNGDVRTLSAGRKYYLRLSSPEGQGSMHFFLGDVRNFLRETRRAVPVAAESAIVLDTIDAEWQLFNLGGVS